MVRQASAASREIQETYVASCSAEMSFGSAGTGEIYIYERLRCGEANGRDTPDFKLCKHTRQLSRILFGKAKAAKERT